MENDETNLTHSQTQCALCDMAMKGSLVIMESGGGGGSSSSSSSRRSCFYGWRVFVAK
jgi:hypothetical protein